MYHGKHYVKSNKSSKKRVALIVSLLLLVCVSVSGVIAFLMDATDPLTNTFKPSKVTTQVVETLNGSEKSNVMIQNTGDTSAWIRATYVVTWKNSDGNVYGKAPVAGTDYKITLNETDWKKGEDGFYYYKSPVVPGGCTENLIISVQPAAAAPNGFTLSVEILGSGIQSTPNSAFEQAWGESSGLTVENGVLGGGA